MNQGPENFTVLSRCWLWESDHQHRFSHVSQSVEDILDVSAKSLLGRTWDELGDTANAGQWHRHLEEIGGTMPVSGLLLHCQFTGGDSRVICIDAEPKHDSSGHFLGYRGAARDVTPLRKFEGDFRQQGEMLRAIIDHSPVAISLKDLEGRYFLSSGRLSALFGENLSLQGKTAYDIFPHDIADQHTKHDREVAQTKTASQREYAVEVNGERRDYLTVKFPVVDERGQVTSIGSISSDITDLKRSEREIRDLNQQLADRLQQLRDTQDQLIRSERLSALGKLVGTVSHELRTPLGTINSSLHTLRGMISAPDEKVDRIHTRIDRNIERCVRIIEDLLDYARSRRASRVPIDMDRWLADLQEDLSLPSPISLMTDLKTGVKLNVDPDALARAVFNVVDNAAAAIMESSSPMTNVCLSSRVRSNRFEIAVSDRGVGMSEEVQSKMLEPLFSTKGFGVGLGLPIVVQIMESHGGGLDVDSSPGEGTTMTLWLPFEDSGE